MRKWIRRAQAAQSAREHVAGALMPVTVREALPSVSRASRETAVSRSTRPPAPESSREGPIEIEFAGATLKLFHPLDIELVRALVDTL